MEDGVWRTIGGRKVYIKKGQSLSDAMKESGKFKGKTAQEKVEEGKKKLAESYTEEELDEEIKGYKEELEEEDITDKRREEIEKRIGELQQEKNERFEKSVNEAYERFHGKTDKEIAEEMAKEKGERLLTEEEQKQREVEFMKNLDKEVNKENEEYSYHKKPEDKEQEEELYQEFKEKGKVGQSYSEYKAEQREKKEDFKLSEADQEEYDSQRDTDHDGHKGRDETYGMTPQEWKKANDEYNAKLDAISEKERKAIDDIYNQRKEGKIDNIEYLDKQQEIHEQWQKEWNKELAKRYPDMMEEGLEQHEYPESVREAIKEGINESPYRNKTDKYTDYYKKENLGEPKNFEKGQKVLVQDSYSGKYDTEYEVVREATNKDKEGKINSNLKGYVLKDKNGNEIVKADTRLKNTANEEYKNYSISDDHIRRISPYDETEYSYARKVGDKWEVKNPIKGEYDTKTFNSREEALAEMKSIDDHINKGTSTTSYEGVHKTTAPNDVRRNPGGYAVDDNIRKQEMLDELKFYEQHNKNYKNDNNWKTTKADYESQFGKYEPKSMSDNIREKTTTKNRDEAKRLVAEKLGIKEKDVSLLTKADGTYDINDNVDWNKPGKTESYDPYKGTPYERKYKSVDEAIKDPNSAMNQYIKKQAEKKAYKKYLKQHPDSKMTLEEYIKSKEK